MWKQSLSIRCCFTCQTRGLLNPLTGADCWAPSLYSLMMVPQQPVPRGGKHFCEKKEVHEPRYRLSWQQIIGPTLSPAAWNAALRVSPPSYRHVPSCPTTSPGSECPRLSWARQQRPIVVFRVHLADVFPSLSLEFLHFLNVRRKLVCSCPSRELCLHFNTLESNRRPITHISIGIFFF